MKKLNYNRNAQTPDPLVRNTQQLTFVRHEDSGHGWLQVPYKILTELGIQTMISHLSYRDGQSVYLEEDCDARIFQRAFEHLHDHEDVSVVEQYDGPESFILALPRYRPDK